MSLPQDVALESYQGRFSVSMTSAHHQANESGRFELVLYPKNHIILDLKTPQLRVSIKLKRKSN